MLMVFYFCDLDLHYVYALLVTSVARAGAHSEPLLSALKIHTLGATAVCSSLTLSVEAFTGILHHSDKWRTIDCIDRSFC